MAVVNIDDPKKQPQVYYAHYNWLSASQCNEGEKKKSIYHLTMDQIDDYHDRQLIYEVCAKILKCKPDEVDEKVDFLRAEIVRLEAEGDKLRKELGDV